MTLFFNIEKKWFKYHAQATAIINTIPNSKLEFSHILRGISSGKIQTSLIIQIEKSTKILISTFGSSYSKSKAKSSAESQMHQLTGLLAGCKFSDNPPDEFQILTHSALLFILGQPTIGNKNQAEELITGLRAVNCKATLVMNVLPITIPLDEAEQRKHKDHRDKYLLDDAQFQFTFGIFITDNDSTTLLTNIKTIVSLVGSIFDSEHSELRILPITGKKAVKEFGKLIWGDVSRASILTTNEITAFWSLPEHSYGIGSLEKPEIFIPPPSSFAQGIEIGNVLGDFDEILYSCYLDPNDIFQHIAVWGSTGLGKSTLIKTLITHLHNNYNIPCLIFDLHDEYSEIIGNLQGEIGTDILIFNPFTNTFSINPLQLIECEGKQKAIIRTETKENFISMLSQIWTLGEVQEQRIRKHLTELYEQKDNPTFGELVKFLETDMKTKTKKDEDNLPRKMEKFTDDFIGEMFNKPNTTLPFDRIEKATTIFELGELSLELRIFFVSIFLIQWWNYRRVQDKNTITPHFIVLDEFTNYNNMVSPRKFLSEGRKYRQGLLASHQGPFQITDKTLLGELIRNTLTKIVFRQTLDDDIKIIMASMGLQGLEWFDYFSRLELGEAIVSMKNISQPFKIQTEDYEPGEDIDNDVRRQMNRLIPYQDEGEIQQDPTETLSQDEKQFLQLVYENVFPQTALIGDLLKIMRGRAFRLKDELVEKNLLSEEEVRKGRGKPLKILSLTDEAYEVTGFEKKRIPGHYGGTEHRYWVHQISLLLEASGWIVQKEHNGTDIRAEKEDNIIAVEVETCKDLNEEQIKTNVQKNLGFTANIWIVCPNDNTRKAIQRVVKSLGVEKLRIITYSEVNRSFNEKEQG